MNRRAASMRTDRYETNRQCVAAGIASSSGRGSPGGWEESHGSGATRRGRRVERQALETGLEGGRRRGAAVEAYSRSPTEADVGREVPRGEARAGRSV